ncbi:MAG: hypothetical protein LBE18_12545 [Planctomycetaceae bacterium]|jgi:hypothetical protein|nr:hypothetical protein [Planctomycetaceae bacterium]
MTFSVVDSISEVLTDRFNDSGFDSAALGDESMMLNSHEVEKLSTNHIDKWNNLVSQTNWEKGALILSWRAALSAASMPKAAYSDEAWSRRVGGVSAQHVGRLRRVAERFGSYVNGYVGLRWSHFQAALDWEDAEMWLEGAVQNEWSVAQMRIQRWEAIGAPEELKPRNEDIFTTGLDTGLDDDVNPHNDSFGTKEKNAEARISEIKSTDIVDGFNQSESSIQKDENTKSKKKQKKSDSKNKVSDDVNLIHTLPTGEILTNLSNNVQTLPTDLAEAIESFKIAILNHKLTSWKEVNADTILNCLETLKALVTANDD